MRLRLAPLGIAQAGASRLRASSLGSESTASVTSIALVVTGSDLFPVDEFHLRHGLVGGWLARSWFSWTAAEGVHVVDFAHGGSSADPRSFVAALSGATRHHVDLGGSTRSASYVADAIVSQLDADGVTASTDGAVVTIAGEGVTSLVIPPDVDTTNTSLRGMWGAQRANWGTGSEGQTLNLNGGTGGTGSVHLGQVGTAGRILGVYLWTRTDTVATVVRLAASSGPAYSVSPGAMTLLSQMERTIQGFGGSVHEAVAFGATDHLWAHYASDTADAGIVFRSHGATPEGRGQQGLNQVLIWDTTRSASSATAFGATYAPVVDATFNIYVSLGIAFEVPDASGNYPANGSWTLRIGDHNDDPNHGTQFDAGPEILEGETTHHRFRLPNWTGVNLTEVWRTVGALAAGEGSRPALYQWSDLDLPSTTPASLIADLGNMGMDTANAANGYTLPSPVAMDTGALGSDAIVSLGFNYIRNGGAITTYTLPVFLTTGGDSYWGNCWTDDRETWHDDIPGAVERGYTAGVSEYRTRASAGNTGMPTTFGATYPDPMATDASDDSPAAIALDWMILRRAGLAAA